jgi:hypothetical protein
MTESEGASGAKKRLGALFEHKLVLRVTVHPFPMVPAPQPILLRAVQRFQPWASSTISNLSQGRPSCTMIMLCVCSPSMDACQA